MAGMATAAVSAAVASFAGLRGLPMIAGWPDRLAWLLPVTIDAYAMTSSRVWLTDNRRRVCSGQRHRRDRHEHHRQRRLAPGRHRHRAISRPG
jgi:hypothetical protein